MDGPGSNGAPVLVSGQSLSASCGFLRFAPHVESGYDSLIPASTAALRTAGLWEGN